MKLFYSTLIAGLMFFATIVPSKAGEIVLGASMAKTGPYSTTARTSETAVDIAVQEINSSG